jgi:hypothetical protein
VIASLSHNYIERFFLEQGHTVERPTDYGTDLIVNTFDKDGYVESGVICIQLKASDNFVYSPDGSCVLFRIQMRHYNAWKHEPTPTFLVLYDAQRVKAYWLYLQASLPEARPREGAKSVTIRIPTANEFSARTVTYMQQRKAAILAQMGGLIKHDG